MPPDKPDVPRTISTLPHILSFPLQTHRNGVVTFHAILMPVIIPQAAFFATYRTLSFIPFKRAGAYGIYILFYQPISSTFRTFVVHLTIGYRLTVPARAFNLHFQIPPTLYQVQRPFYGALHSAQPVVASRLSGCARKQFPDPSSPSNSP